MTCNLPNCVLISVPLRVAMTTGIAVATVVDVLRMGGEFNLRGYSVGPSGGGREGRGGEGRGRECELSIYKNYTIMSFLHT